MDTVPDGDPFVRACADDIAGKALLEVVAQLVAWLRHDIRSETALRQIDERTSEVVAELDAHQGRHWKAGP